MAIGTVKWFNNAKGYGFLRPVDGGEDIFVHFSSIEMEGYKSLKAGQKVYYEVNKGPKGLHAAMIKPEDEAAAPHSQQAASRETLASAEA